MDNVAMLFCRLASALLLLVAAVAPGEAAAQDGPIEKREFVCMMQDSVMLKPGIPIEHGGKTYFGCCPMCSRAIKQNPERFTKAQDPVTGATVDKAAAFAYGLGGSAFYFESEASREAFGRDPSRYLGKARPLRGRGNGPEPDAAGTTARP